MIPTDEQVKRLWDKYQLPEMKRIHVRKVAEVARWMARKIKNQKAKIKINEKLLEAGALLHDIDKKVPRLPGEKHPETSVRVLKEERMNEVAELIKYHSVQFILNEATAPKSLEEKILFLADKMVKYEIITVDERFALWRAEDLPEEGRKMLGEAYRKVKMLEREILEIIGVKPEDVAKLIGDGVYLGNNWRKI